jgi:DNA helicase-2/ATP-dependent DNA helicase PcrA
MTSIYLENLNEKQKEAVMQTEGSVLIVAGAGAGKTKTITHRIMYIIEKGVNPENILAITFTNKAGKEMKERVLKMFEENQSLYLENGRKLPVIKTFHSLGVYIIKENAEKLGLPRHFAILDKSDSKKIFKKSLEELGFDPKEHLDKVSNIISAEKNKGVSFEKYKERESYDFSSDLTKKVWNLYENYKKKEKSLDFDDLLLTTLKLLEENKDVLDFYSNKFKYVHIDEYQDTNTVQDKIAELLSSKHKNICVVGDTDQNIYSWRGADIKNMLNFEKKTPRNKDYSLGTKLQINKNYNRGIKSSYKEKQSKN